MRRLAFVLLVSLALVFHASIASAANYDESVNGDLSGDRNAPTLLPLGLGANRVRAMSVSGDLEYFRVAIPAGTRLSAINLISSNGNLSFIAVQQGTIFTEPPTGTNVANLLGYSHFGNGNATVGTDILDNVGAGAGAIGFTGSLAQPNYCFWSQETGATQTTYELDFVVIPAQNPVPIPWPFSAALAAALGIAGMVAVRRRSAS